MRNIYLSALLALFIINAHAQVFTIGPTLHLNLKNNSQIISYGIEAAIWNSSEPFGVDFGLEFSKASFKIYSEFESGIFIIGSAIGPVFVKDYGGKIKLGLQVTGWANYYFGLDFRGTFFKNDSNKNISYGMYYKYFNEEKIDTRKILSKAQ